MTMYAHCSPGSSTMTPASTTCFTMQRHIVTATVVHWWQWCPPAACIVHTATSCSQDSELLCPLSHWSPSLMAHLQRSQISQRERGGSLPVCPFCPLTVVPKSDESVTAPNLCMTLASTLLVQSKDTVDMLCAPVYCLNTGWHHETMKSQVQPNHITASKFLVIIVQHISWWQLPVHLPIKHATPPSLGSWNAWSRPCCIFALWPRPCTPQVGKGRHEALIWPGGCHHPSSYLPWRHAFSSHTMLLSSLPGAWPLSVTSVQVLPTTQGTTYSSNQIPSSNLVVQCVGWI